MLFTGPAKRWISSCQTRSRVFFFFFSLVYWSFQKSQHRMASCWCTQITSLPLGTAITKDLQHFLELFLQHLRDFTAMNRRKLKPLHNHDASTNERKKSESTNSFPRTPCSIQFCTRCSVPSWEQGMFEMMYTTQRDERMFTLWETQNLVEQFISFYTFKIR